MAERLITLRAADGHILSAYQVRPQGIPRGGIVLLQEIFGLTAHIRHVCDEYAALGYAVTAPALFDRVRPGVELGYGKKAAAFGRELRGEIPLSQTLADVAAAVAHLQKVVGPIATVGYCWGGTVSWRAAAHVAGISAAVCYYPTLIGPHAQERPNCPVLMHFGDRDPIATLADAGTLRAAHGATVEIQVYPTSHGFNCNEIPAFDSASAALALNRTTAFLADHLGTARDGLDENPIADGRGLR